MANPVSALVTSAVRMGGLLIRSRTLLSSITRVELRKRYAGSVIGTGWILLQPALLLSMYLFVYLVVFKMRFPGLSSWEYVLYVFTGLVPYLGFMDALTTGGTSLKQNMHFVKNVLLPIELIPVRSVLVGMASQFVSLAFVLVLITLTGHASLRIVWLPLVIALQIAALAGATWILATITVALPDVTYIVSLLVFLLMWLSPIGFTTDMVPPSFRFTIYLNPVAYLVEAYRASTLGMTPVRLPFLIGYAVGCLTLFAVGATFFTAFKSALVDLE